MNGALQCNGAFLAPGAGPLKGLFFRLFLGVGWGALVVAQGDGVVLRVVY